MSNYSENIFQAIDEIVSARLNEVSFDRTIQCTIAQIIEDEPNVYWVTDGSTRFKAKDLQEKGYKENQQVYVTIQNGDYNLEKWIVGRYTADDLPKYLWTNPFDDLVYGAKWEIVSSPISKIINPEAGRPEFNKAFYHVLNKLNSSSIVNNTGFNYIGLEFSFNNQLEQYKGTFDIVIELKENETGEVLHSLVLSSTQLYGNPYTLSEDLTLYHLFSYPASLDPEQIGWVDTTLYTRNDFDEIDSGKLIKLTKATLYFGYSAMAEENKLEDSFTIELKKGQTTEFDTRAEESKDFLLTWIKDEKIFSASADMTSLNEAFPQDDVVIRWYSYQYGAENTNEEIGGTFWVQLKETNAKDIDAYRFSFAPRLGYVLEKIKAVVIRDNEILATSNIIELRAFNGPEQNPEIQKSDLVLTFENGSHFDYDNSGKLDVRENKFKVQFDFENQSNKLREDDIIRWEIIDSPQIKGFVIEEAGEEKITDEKFIEFKVTADKLKAEDYSAYYALADILSATGNSKIKCTVTGKNYIVSGEGFITVGNKNTAGTGYIFNLEIDKDGPSQVVSRSRNIRVKAILYDKEKKLVNMEGKDVVWSWYSIGQQYTGSKPTIDDVQFFGYYDGENISPIKETKTNEENKDIVYNQITGSSEIIIGLLDKGYKEDGIEFVNENSPVPSEFTNYHILMAQYKAIWATDVPSVGETNEIKQELHETILTAYLPIPWSSDPSEDGEDFVFYGPTVVTYSPSGQNPEYSKSSYFFKYGKEETWESLPLYTRAQDESSAKPSIKIEDSEQYLIPQKTFQFNNPISYVGYYDGDDKFYQHPILTIQNTYMYDTINKWGGKTQINEEDNSIMTGFLVAGKKDFNKNTFTGVMIGNIGDYATEGGTTITSGILGQKDGTNIFYIGTDGQANISGWDIGTSYIEKINDNSTRFYINSNPTQGTYDSWIAAGVYNEQASYKWDWPFYILKNGEFHSTKAVIEGQIKATSGVLEDGIKFGTSGLSEIKDWELSGGTRTGTAWDFSYSKKVQSRFYMARVSNRVQIYLGANNDGMGAFGGSELILRGDGMVELSGNWEAAVASTSDINQKNNISSLSENYSILFDNLHPVVYKYNYGTSNRLHTGFIAQKVKEALDIANISTQDFAGLVIQSLGTEKELWGLRYEEFVALNTWQIQKLKARVTELENEIKELKK